MDILFLHIIFKVMTSMNSTWQDIINLRQQLSETVWDYWVRDNLFSWQWWLHVITLIVVYTIWWKLVDKKRLREVVIFGLLIMIMSSILDIIGVDFMLWGYPNMIFPLAPPIVFDNYATLPPVFSLVYQYSRNWRSFIIATIVMAGAFAFIVEPALVWAKIYDLHN